jgi:hypothetical protein
MADRYLEPIQADQVKCLGQKALLVEAQYPPAEPLNAISEPAPGAPVSRSPASQTPGPRESARKALLFRASRAMNDREPEAVVAGLPAEVMDGLVEDLAEAVVAMLLRPPSAEPGTEDDASRDLRQV